MIIAIKNFKRNGLCNLTITSIRQFMPDATIVVFNLFKDSFTEYDAQPSLLVPSEAIFYRRSRYTDLGPSVANQFNNLFFSEGYNYIWEEFYGCSEKLLMLAEDHFFTTGATLRELQSASFDIAYAPWDAGCNGSLLCVVPANLRHAFPIPEDRTTVEHTFMNWIRAKVAPERVHALSTRAAEDYRGDGIYSNDAGEIRRELEMVGIALPEANT